MLILSLQSSVLWCCIAKVRVCIRILLPINFLIAVTPNMQVQNQTYRCKMYSSFTDMALDVQTLNGSSNYTYGPQGVGNSWSIFYDTCP